MPEKTQRELTKEWVMTMLYGSGQNINQLVENGCRVMVFGIEYEEFICNRRYKCNRCRR